MRFPYVRDDAFFKDLQKRLALTDADVANIQKNGSGGVEARAAFGALAFARLVDFASTEPELAYWFFAYLCSGAKCEVGAGVVDAQIEFLDTKKRGC